MAFLPFKLRPSIRKLKEWRQDDEDSKWADKAIDLLVKKLSSNLDSILELQRVLENPETPSDCITITQSLDGRLQVGNRKGQPHVIYCRVWRWPDLQNHNELVATEECTCSYSKEKAIVCVNPYHYRRVEANRLPTIMVMRDPQYGTGYLPKKFSLPNSQLEADSSATCTADLDAPGPSSISFTEVPKWCTIYYNELNHRIGEPYKPTNCFITVDGYTDVSTEQRFCLGSHTALHRNNLTERTRKHIGDGIALSYVGGDLYLDNMCEHSVYVESRTAARFMGYPDGAVMKVPAGHNVKAFSSSMFGEILQAATRNGYEALYKLPYTCTVFLSFIKGWGKEYKRKVITDTPCWLEIQMNSPLKWLDGVLATMRPTSSITSRS